MFALALAVGLTPELLPMIVTVTLARSALQLSRRNVIVKRLSAIHDLGAMNVLCTDKTGTLTEATIKLVRAIDGRGAESKAVFANAYINSQFETGMKSPLDQAILSAHSFDMVEWKKIDEVPFDFERRRVSVLVERGAERSLIVKGAPEDLLRLSGRYEDADGKVLPLDPETRRSFEATLDELGAQGLASRVVETSHETAAIRDESDLVFSGFAVFLDPPKASAGATIQAMTTAGISVKVLTGDNELVSRHVLVFAIRTRRPIFRSRPHVFLAAMALGVVIVAIALPLLPVGQWFGFVAPPPLFFVFLIGTTLAYLAIVEITKHLFYGAKGITNVNS